MGKVNYLLLDMSVLPEVYVKVDAVQYYHDHKELGLIGCA